MGLAEKTIELYKIVAEADEETTAKLISFYESLDQHNQFTNEEVAEFERRSEEFLKNPESAIPWDESMSRLRNMSKK